MSQTGTLPFNQIPATKRGPLFFVEFDNTQANSALTQQRTLLIGQITSSGLATPNKPRLASSLANVIQQCGAGSMLADMYSTYVVDDPDGEVWLGPVLDAGGATPAVGNVAFTAAATAAGVLSLYIGGVLVSMPVATTQTTAQLATALAAAINATPNIFVTAAVDGVTVTKVDITAVNAGLEGNDIDLRLNYGGSQNYESTPVGLGVTLTAFVGGATNPTLTTLLANCGNRPFDFIVLPYTDSTSINALQAFLANVGGRWAYNIQIYGHVVIAYRGTLSAITTFGAGRNNPHESVIGFYDSPSPNWRWAADFFAAMAVALRADPARPMQTLRMTAVQAPPQSSQFNDPENEALLYSGISTFAVANDGTVTIQKTITTYQFNAFGQPDNSYLGIEVLFQLMFLMRDLAVYVTSKYPRCKLVANGTRLAPGVVGVVSPNQLLADMRAHYAFLCTQGQAQDPTAFNQYSVLVQDPSNPNRINFLWAGTLMDQLNIFAVLAQFRNQAA